MFEELYYVCYIQIRAYLYYARELLEFEVHRTKIQG